MTTDLARFDFEGNPFRGMTIDGEAWVVGIDACNALGLTNSRAALGRLDTDGVRTTDVIDGMGRSQQTTIINEPALYELIFQSRRPEAVAFRRWVTREVLPSIRRTGTYGPSSEIDVTDPGQLSRVLRAATAALEQLQIERSGRQVAEAAVAEMKPKADGYDTYLEADGGDRLVREAAKLLGMQENTLRSFLLSERLIFARQRPCGDRKYDFHAEFAEHFTAREHVVNHRWGNCTHYTLLITPRGMDLIRRRLRGGSSGLALVGDAS